MRRLTAIAGSISLLMLAALPTGATAMSTHTTLNGGAMNMLHDATMGATMTEHVNANGDAGMFHATCLTDDVCG